MKRLFSISAGAILAGACSDGSSYPLPPRPRPTINFTIQDLTTSAGNSTPGVTVLGHSYPVLESDIAELATGTRLLLWPERSEVAVRREIRFVPAVTSGAVRSAMASVDLQPTEPLGDRWYAVEVTHVPAMFTFEPGGSYKPPPPSTIARFRPGSYPVLKKVGACIDPSGSGTVHLRASESVPSSTWDGTRVVVGTGDECQGTDGPQGTDVTFDCARLSSSQLVGVSFDPTNPFGRTLVGGRVEFVPRKLPVDPVHRCPAMTPPLVGL